MTRVPDYTDVTLSTYHRIDFDLRALFSDASATAALSGGLKSRKAFGPCADTCHCSTHTYASLVILSTLAAARPRAHHDIKGIIAKPDYSR